MPRYTNHSRILSLLPSFIAHTVASPRARRFILPSILALGLLYLFFGTSDSASTPVAKDLNADGYRWPGWPEQQTGRERASWGALRQVGARAKIKENLKPDLKYLIAFSLSGWNNQVIDMLNHVHLAVMSDRVPVVTPFYPHYVHYDEVNTRDLPVGRVFDLKRLSIALADRPIVEAHELKRVWAMDKAHAAVVYDGETSQPGAKRWSKLKKGSKVEPEQWGKGNEVLGCWSFYGNFGGEGSAPMDRIGLDLDYTPLPSALFPGGTETYPCSFQGISDLLRRKHTSIPPTSQTTLDKYPYLARPKGLPDDHLACLDSAYWVQDQPGVTDLHGEWRNGVGVWQAVGRHVYFREELQDLADAALGELFNLRKGDEIPPFVAIHIRRGDFGQEWMKLTPRHYAHFADSIRRSIKRETGVIVEHVVVATDEEDPQWLGELRLFGWHLTQDYDAWTETAADDQWLPIVLDSVILSRALGFVGPGSSTMSILSYQRVKEWNHGISQFIYPHDTVPDHWSWSWDLSDA